MSSIIAKGSGGQVLRGILGGKQVAIKKLPGNLYSTRKELEFCRAKIVHDHIVPILDVRYSSDEDYAYIYMPLADTDLLDLCVKNPGEHLCKHVKRVALALQHCHNNGFYHRDVKVENVLIKDNNTWLADFGLSTTNMVSDSATGTNNVCCPEIYKNLREHENNMYDCAMADTWSLGIMLYSVITSKIPWRAPVETDTLYERFVSGTHKRPTNMSAQAYDLFRWATHHDASKRCNLDEFLNHEFMKSL